MAQRRKQSSELEVALGERPEPGSPADVIRGLILAAGGVTEAEAKVLLKVLRQLAQIEAEEGRVEAYWAARRVRTAWLAEAA
jgi:hypothetical protein